ncbi:MAG: LbtU family siderophore porin [Nitrospirae bacterium]|nr:LbtU family siderophore porin [Nitrospirota bacterium]
MQNRSLSVCCVLICTFVLLALLIASSPAYAGEAEALLNLLLKRGLITEQEYEELTAGRAEGMKEQKAVADASAGTEMSDRVVIEGAIEGEYRWMKHREVTARDSDSTSDLYLRTIELGIGVKLTDWIIASAVFNSEWIGDDVNAGDEMLTVDEAVITLQKEDAPFYIVAGKRTQPFGLFESHLITDPMTQDGYETKRAGITAGYAGPAGADLSLTVYKGEEQMNHLFESGLFDTEAVSRTDAADDVGSFIVSVYAEPVEEALTLFAGYLSEPGAERRNETLNLGFNLVLPFLENLRVDGEYMKAIKRERYTGADREFKEGVLSLSAAYEFVLRKREVIGGGLFEERRAHIISEPLEVSLRYEYFDDDGFADSLNAWSVKDRYSAGARYSFYNDEASGLNAFLSVEYRHTGLRVDSPADMEEANDEIYARMGVNF